MSEAFDKALAAHERLVAAKAAHNDADGKACLAYNDLLDTMQARYVEAIRHLVPDAKLLIEMSYKFDHFCPPVMWMNVVSMVEKHDAPKPAKAE